MDRDFEYGREKSIFELFRACRLCGAGAGYKMPIMQSIVTDEEENGVKLYQKIRDCLQIEVYQNDKMPPLICELCVDKVNDFYEFLEMTRHTVKRTRTRLGLSSQSQSHNASDGGDCILGMTEPLHSNEDSNDEPLSKQKLKLKTKGKKRQGSPPPQQKAKKRLSPVPVVSLTRSSFKGHIKDMPVSKPIKLPINAKSLRNKTPFVVKIERMASPPRTRTTRQSIEEEKKEIFTRHREKEKNLTKVTSKIITSKDSPRVQLRITKMPQNLSNTQKSDLKVLSTLKTPVVALKSLQNIPKSLLNNSKTPSPKTPQSVSKTHQNTSKIPSKGILKNSIKQEEDSLATTRTRTPGKRTHEKELHQVPQTKKVKISITPPVKKQSPVEERPLRQVVNKPIKLGIEKKEPVKRDPVKREPTKKETVKEEPPQKRDCPVCAITFNKLQAYNSHMRIHSASHTEEKLACNTCGEWFTDQDESSTHHLWHKSTHTPYNCRICNADFDQYSHYTRHFETNSCLPDEVPDVQCPDCNRIFITQNLLDLHKKRQKCLAANKSDDSPIGETTNLMEQVRPMKVRIARCDSLLKNVKSGHYDVSDVDTSYGLDERCYYPYIMNVQVKSEPNDFVKSDTFQYDSDANGDPSDDLDELEKIKSLAKLSLRVVHSHGLLGNVAKRKTKLAENEMVRKHSIDELNDTENIDEIDADVDLGKQSAEDAEKSEKGKLNTNEDIEQINTDDAGKTEIERINTDENTEESEIEKIDTSLVKSDEVTEKIDTNEVTEKSEINPDEVKEAEIDKVTNVKIPNEDKDKSHMNDTAKVVNGIQNDMFSDPDMDDISDIEIDDKQLMEDIDAQLNDKDESRNGEESHKRFEETSLGDEESGIHRECDVSDGKITLEDLNVDSRKDKSLELDNISDGELQFD